jgi:hypothetical protein
MTVIMSYLFVSFNRLFFGSFDFQNMAIPNPELTRVRASISRIFDEICHVAAEDGLTSQVVLLETCTGNHRPEAVARTKYFLVCISSIYPEKKLHQFKDFCT